MSSQMTMFQTAKPQGKWRPPETLPELGRYKKIWLDNETTGKNVYHDTPVGTAIATVDKVFYLPHSHAGGGNLDRGLVKRWMERELRDKDIVGLGMKFDHHTTKNWGVDLEAQGNRLHDIAYKAALLNEHRYSGLDLDSLGKEYVGRGKVVLNLDPAKIAEAHSSEVGPYGEGDAALTRDVDIATDPLIAAEDLGTVLELEDSLIYCVCEMERNGARLDVPKLEQWSREITEEYSRLILEIWRQTKKRINPDSGPDLSELFRILGLKNMSRTAGGDESFTASVLKKFDHPLVQMALKARRLNSIKSKYVDKYLKAVGKDGIIRYQLHQLKTDDFGTITGRFSSSAPSTGGMNVQQVMKPDNQRRNFGPDYIIRDLFIPDDGYDWLSSDAKQIEFRLFVHYTASERLLEHYRKDPDVDFHNVVWDMLKKRRANLTRYHAKIGNFGVIYGLSDPASAAEQLECEEDEARQFMEDYDLAFPEARRLLNHASRIAQRRGYVKTFLGRRGRFHDKKGFHRALNKVLQGTAADVNKKKLKEFYDNRATLGVHKLRLTNHDEVDADVDKDPKYKTMVKELMDQQCVQFRVPILWDVKTGPNWGAC
jgi:DNA polymerase I-like protein with 3'-5' exonuclease and polymerase domains